MNTERCLVELLDEVIGTELTPAQQAEIEADTMDGDLICKVLGCPHSGCDRESAVVYRGDELYFLEAALAGVCQRRVTSTKTLA